MPAFGALLSARTSFSRSDAPFGAQISIFLELIASQTLERNQESFDEGRGDRVFRSLLRNAIVIRVGGEKLGCFRSVHHRKRVYSYIMRIHKKFCKKKRARDAAGKKRLAAAPAHYFNMQLARPYEFIERRVMKIQAISQSSNYSLQI